MNQPTWLDAERICNLPDVHEALQAFCEDATHDNGVGVVVTVMAALAAQEPVAWAWYAPPKNMEEAGGRSGLSFKKPEVGPGVSIDIMPLYTSPIR